MLRNIAVAAGGIWIGNMLSSGVNGLIPATGNSTADATIAKVVNVAVPAFAVVYALKLLGHRHKG